MSDWLEHELKTYHENLAELQEKNKDGGFVLIFKERIIDVFKSRTEALIAGYKEVKSPYFLVKDIFEDSKRYDIKFLNILEV